MWPGLPAVHSCGGDADGSDVCGRVSPRWRHSSARLQRQQQLLAVIIIRPTCNQLEAAAQALQAGNSRAAAISHAESQ